MCVPAVIFVPNPWRWVVAAAAILLPYISVVFANGGREPESESRFTPYEPEESSPSELENGHREIIP